MDLSSIDIGLVLAIGIVALVVIAVALGIIIAESILGFRRKR